MRACLSNVRRRNEAARGGSRVVEIKLCWKEADSLTSEKGAPLVVQVQRRRDHHTSISTIKVSLVYPLVSRILLHPNYTSVKLSLFNHATRLSLRCVLLSSLQSAFAVFLFIFIFLFIVYNILCALEF